MATSNKKSDDKKNFKFTEFKSPTNYKSNTKLQDSNFIEDDVDFDNNGVEDQNKSKHTT